MKKIRKYIIVDDDPFNNVLGCIALKNALGLVDTKTFTQPEEGLAFVKAEYPKIQEPTILFLDINMPTLTGWEFMEQFEKLDKVIKENISVYILSSSVDQRDKDKAKANPSIKGFISKPLESETILELAGI